MAGVAAGLVAALSGGGKAPAPSSPAPASRPAQPPHAPGQGFVVGVNLSPLFLHPDRFPPALVDRQLAAASAAGVRVARTDALWEATEPEPPRGGRHVYRWEFDDRVALALAGHRIRWWPIIDYAPAWASGARPGVHAPPRDDAGFAAYAAAFARRYGPGGDFWRAHPQLPQLPVDVYEIWNEESSPGFWSPRPDPARYASLFSAARAAIHRAQPGARVLVGGLTPKRGYLAAMVAARPEVAADIDGVAIHPYASTPDGVMAHVGAARAEADRVGLHDVPLSVTELGWWTQPPRGRWYAPEPVRARWIAGVVTRIASSGCGVDAVLWFAWVSTQADPGNGDDWYGVVGPSAAPTPSSQALTALLRRPAGAWPDPSRSRGRCAPPPAR